MNRATLFFVLAFALVGCGINAATPTATLPPLPVATAAPQAPPTPTSFIEGLPARLSTPDAAANCPERIPWFFNNTVGECAGQVLNTWAVFQRFERGLMVWFQEGGRTFILHDDGSLIRPMYEAIDGANTPLPEPDASIVPPPGMYQPVLGFGKFWRGLVPGYEWVRERLGWATQPEVGFSALLQCNTLNGPAARCYFTGPRDEVLVMTRGAERYWAYWQGPVR